MRKKKKYNICSWCNKPIKENTNIYNFNARTGTKIYYHQHCYKEKYYTITSELINGE